MNRSGATNFPKESRYFRLRRYLRTTFGQEVRKISVDAGFSCPNVDGTIGTGGCIFCDPKSFSPSRRRRVGSITEQLTAAVERFRRWTDATAFIAYFQPSTNTHAPLPELRRAYEEAIEFPQIAGLAIGTRPDCLAEEVLDLLSDVHEKTWLCTEIGLQTIHPRTLRRIRRGHSAEAFFDAARRLEERGLRFGAHVIVGLPDESREEIRATASALAQTDVHSVKLHNPYVTKDTEVERLWRAGEWPLPTKAEYVSLAADFLERLPPTCVIDRLTGEAPAEYLVAPDWCRHKASVIQAIEAELARRGTRQGERVGKAEG